MNLPSPTRSSRLAAGILCLVTLSAACAPPAPPSREASKNHPSTPARSAQPAPIPATPPARAHAPTQANVPTPAAQSPPAFSLILGRPTATAISVSVLSAIDRKIVLAYRAAAGNDEHLTEPIALKASQPGGIDITLLRPDTEYRYRVIADGVSGGDRAFHTQRAPGGVFTFTLDADPHNRDPRFNGELYAATLKNALADQPDFHINLGDTFMTEKLKPATYSEAESTFADMRPYLGIVGAKAPLFLVNGNHEGELGWLLPRGSDRELPIWSAQLRQRYYPNPTPNGFYSGGTSLDASLGGARDGYYAWTWGDALFVVLDPFWYTTDKPKAGGGNGNWGWTLGRAQYDWLKATLTASASKYKFVFIHHLVGGSDEARGGVEFASLYEWGGKNADGTYGFDAQRPGWGKPIHTLLVENQVSAVLHGHDHVYVKQELDGIVYQEVPQPSNADYNNTRIAAEYGYTQGVVLGSSGHLRVIVTPAGATVEYVRAYLPRDEKAGQRNGQVDHRYVIAPARGR